MLLVLAAWGTSALGHANYVRSVPEQDARLARPPSEVRVSFSERPEVRFSEITVLDVDGRRVDRGDLASADDLTLKVGLLPLGEGGYTVAWKVLSAVDGHETRGSFAFAIGTAPLPRPPDIESAPPPGPAEIAGRALTFCGTALLVGIPLFGLVVARDPVDRRGLRAVARAGAVLLLAGTGLLLAASGGLALLDTGLGRILQARAGLAALALLPLPAAAAVAIGAAEGASLTLASHAAASNDLVSVAMDLVHVLAMGTWAGGLVALAVVALPRRGVRTASQTRSLGELVGRFSTLGIVATALLVGTGVFQSLRRLADVRDLIETPYGLALLAKVGLLVLALGLASLNLLRHGPRLRAGTVQGSAATRRLLVLGVRGEVALVALILVAASVLTALVPPNTVTGAAFAKVEHAGGLRIELFVQSADPGQNRYVVRLQDGLRPATNVEEVRLRFTMVEHDMGEQELLTRERAPGEYVAEGSPTAMYGTWKTLVVVRRSDRDDARALFTVPIAGGGPGGIRTRIVSAGDHTLIVFTQPPLPVVGQPLTLFVVPVDATGNPVSGASLRAELEGRAYSATVEEGVRYRIELPALARAGGTRIDLVLTLPGGDARGAYELTVAP